MPGSDISDRLVGRPLHSRLKMKHLELFRNVCVCQTLRKAAAASNMTQPAATKLIQELEDMLATRLFERDRRGMRLTHAGEVLQRHVLMLLADVDNMQEEIGLLANDIVGTIRLGVIPSLSPQLLAASIAALLQEHPRTQIELHEARTKELLVALAKKELDMTFGRVLEFDATRHFDVMHIYDESFSIVCRPGHPLAGGSHVTWDMLARRQWILPVAGSPLRHLVDSLFTQQSTLRPTATVECDSFEKIQYLIEFTDLLSILPRSLIAQKTANKTLQVIKPDIGKELAPISLILRKNDERTPIMRAFIDVICKSRAFPEI